MDHNSPICDFHGENIFLSNFHPCPVTVDGITYPSVEHYYQAHKTLDVSIREKIAGLETAGSAKRLGSRLKIRKDWNADRLDIMWVGLKLKFQIPELREKLLATGDQELIEGNWWGDVFWGVSKGKGLNHLGRLLMEVRNEIRNEDALSYPNDVLKTQVIKEVMGS